ncbi:1-deoxy-D-xylulose-5-phosphate synthase [bacterium]|nr:1-deoxy-D-xylulose-5-phosphate synthase [bacterium]
MVNINSPNDIKELTSSGRDILVSELREFIIESVSQTGGHLAPSLGVIELTIALLSLYSPPFDKIVWDVGHQAYPFKILTGRRDRFDSLRQKGGISGFPKLTESEYDAFGVGHASTSIGAALGMATARDILKKEYKVVAIIGDGALSGGLAFEGLNNAGASARDMLVILNDNEMSISRNVGALSKYLTEIIVNQKYRKIKNGIWDLAEKVPMTQQLRYIGQKVEDSIKSLINVRPGMLFESLGFDYFGPIDGHDINATIKILHEMDEFPGPKLLHIMTRKGKGYRPAEDDACKFHGISAFDPATGEKELSNTKKETYTSVFESAMVEMAEKFDKLCAITAAMETGTGLAEFHRLFPKRFFDVGIAEGHAVLFGTGLALSGIPTVVAIYSSFLQRALDQLIHDAALQNIAITVAVDRAGIVGEDGPTHHGVFDLSFLRGIPNLIIAAPHSTEELRQMLFTAISHKNGPFILRYPRSVVYHGRSKKPLELIKIGTWDKLREGEDAAVFAVGSMVEPALKVAANFHSKGIEIEIINARFVQPIDEAILCEVAKRHKKIITIEENVVVGGFGEALAGSLFTCGWKGDLLRIGIPDKFIEHGSRDELIADLGLNAEGLFASISKFIGDSAS